jgi:SAM-dependent methyltransferase
MHREDIRGRVLEIGTTATVHKFGGSNVQRAEAIDIIRANNKATIVADLAKADHLPSDQFDCFVNQFTMHIIYDFKDALYHSIRLLKPGGVLLVNFQARSGYPTQGIDLEEVGKTWVYWWFTPAVVEKVLEELGLTEKDYEIMTYGNLFGLVAYMAGIGAEELTPYELEYEDSDIPLLICVRVIKPLRWRPKWEARY